MRVAAALMANQHQVVFLGYGTYDGDEVPDPTTPGLPGKLGSVGRKNPKITLDNGDVVWGCECWWGSAENFDAKFEGVPRVQVNISDYRS